MYCTLIDSVHVNYKSSKRQSSCMPFKLTVEYLQSILDPTEKGDWQSFTDAIDPDVRWWIVSDQPSNYSKAGVYV